MRVFVTSVVDLGQYNAQRTHLLEEWGCAARDGHSVYLWAIGADPEREHWSDVHVVVPPHFRIPWLREISFQFFVFVSIVWCALSDRPDVIYVRNAAADFAPLLAAIIFRVPYILELHGPILEEARALGVRPSKVALTRRLLGLKVRCAQRIVAVTDQIGEDVSRAYNLPLGRVVVIPNGANVDMFRPADGTAARAEIGIPEHAPVVGFVGNLHPWQGLDTLARAARLVRNVNSRTLFLIVGEGVERVSLETKIRQLGLTGAFFFTGAVPYYEVPRYIAACDVMVAPLVPKEDHDSGYSPLKVYEYLACERPVVCSALKGLEFVAAEGLGKLVPSRNVESLAEAILETLANRREAAEMGVRGRIFVSKHYSWHAITDRCLQVLRDATMPRTS